MPSISNRTMSRVPSSRPSEQTMPRWLMRPAQGFGTDREAETNLMRTVGGHGMVQHWRTEEPNRSVAHPLTPKASGTQNQQTVFLRFQKTKNILHLLTSLLSDTPCMQTTTTSTTPPVHKHPIFPSRMTVHSVDERTSVVRPDPPFLLTVKTSPLRKPGNTPKSENGFHH